MQVGGQRSGQRGAARPIPLCTVGYERATVDEVTEALRRASVGLLVDVRAVTSSRRPGFSKSRLSAQLIERGIDYLHLRGLGTPAEGRAAARSGRHEEMRRIFAEHLRTVEARDDLDTLAELVAGGRRACLLCFEADPAHCHRTLVAEALAEMVPVEIQHLRPGRDADEA